MRNLKPRSLVLFLISASLIGGLFVNVVDVSAQNNPEELKSIIRERSRELENLRKEKEKLGKKLEEINKTQNSLQNEINRINNRIKQLSVSIRSNELEIEKLNLELESLNKEIQSTENRIQKTKKVMNGTLVRLQQQDRQNPLSIVLSSNSLAESMKEIESIMRLSGSLSENLKKLENLRKSLKNQIEKAEARKQDLKREKQALANRQSIISQQKEEKRSILSEFEDEESAYREKIEELDERQKAISESIDEIEQRLRESFNPDSLPTPRHGFLSFPVEDVLLTQCYGKTKFADNAYKSNSHSGADFQADIGTPILAVADGEVVRVDNNDQGIKPWQKYQYGKYVVVEHGENLTSLYSHLSQRSVKEGDRIKAGEVVGYSGSTGYITGPHLHLGLYWTPSLQYRKFPPVAGRVPVGVTIDPVPYLPKESNLENCL